MLAGDAQMAAHRRIESVNCQEWQQRQFLDLYIDSLFLLDLENALHDLS